MADTSKLRKLVIAIDFGTTFSGAAWALSTVPNDVNHLDGWPNTDPDADPQISDKVPTRLMRIGAGRTHWGFQIPRDAPSDQTFRCFKLYVTPLQPRQATMRKD